MADETPAEQSKVAVRLLVAMSEADLGHAAVAGDVVEIDADQAERWILAGIAEASDAAIAPTEQPPEGGVVVVAAAAARRRSGTS